MTDNGVPVISLNESHGPSFPDLAGLVLILASWLASTIVVIKRWNAGNKQKGPKHFIYIAYPLSPFCFRYHISAVIISRIHFMDLCRAGPGNKHFFYYFCLSFKVIEKLIFLLCVSFSTALRYTCSGVLTECSIFAWIEICNNGK